MLLNVAARSEVHLVCVDSSSPLHHRHFQLNRHEPIYSFSHTKATVKPRIHAKCDRSDLWRVVRTRNRQRTLMTCVVYGSWC